MIFHNWISFNWVIHQVWGWKSECKEAIVIHSSLIYLYKFEKENKELLFFLYDCNSLPHSITHLCGSFIEHSETLWHFRAVSGSFTTVHDLLHFLFYSLFFSLHSESRNWIWKSRARNSDRVYVLSSLSEAVFEIYLRKKKNKIEIFFFYNFSCHHQLQS
jgi:hypothetical protein